MAKFASIQNSFSSGELSPRLQGRTDIREYPSGLEKLENFIPLPSGGAARRPGSQHVRDIASISDNSSLYPFIFSREEAYTVLVDMNGLDPLVTSPIRVFDRDGTEVSVTVDTSTDYAIPVFATALDAKGFHIAQSADVLIMAHESGTLPPILLSRTALDTFTVKHLLQNARSPVLGFPYNAANVGATPSVQPSATTGNITLTSSSPIFTANLIGSNIRLTESGGGDTGVARITGFTSTTLVNATVLVNFQSTISTGNWELSTWSDEFGWPRTVSIFEQRLVFGGNISQPDTLWGSEQFDFFTFMFDRLDQDLVSDTSGLDHFGTLTSVDPYALTIASQEVNAIQWLSGSRLLHIGTLGTEYVAGGGTTVLSTANPDIRPQTHEGGTSVFPARAGIVTIYVSRDGKSLFRFQFSDENGTYISTDLSILSDDIVNHLFDEDIRDDKDKSYQDNIIKKLVYQTSRNTVWAITSRKALIGLTINPTSGVTAWHRHTIAGENTVTGHAEIQGITSIPNIDNTHDDLWLLTKRSINGLGDKYYLEKITDDFQHPELVNNSTNENDHPVFSDSALRRKFVTNAAINFVDGDVTVGTDQVDTNLDPEESSGLNTGRRIGLTTTGTLPTPLATGTNYYLIVVDRGVYKFATSRVNALAGTAIDITAASGGGTHTISTNDPGETTTEVWSELNHLEGEEVAVLSGGKVIQSTTTVTNGTIQLVDKVDEVVIGLAYNSDITSLRLEVGQNFGSAQNAIKRFHKVILRVHKSLTGKIGESTDTLDKLELDSTTALITGDIEQDFPGGPSEEGQIFIRADEPLPLTVLSMIVRGVTYE